MKQIIMLILFSWLSAQSVESAVQTMGMQYDDNVLCSASLPPSKNGSNPYKEEEDLLYPDIKAEGLPFGDYVQMYPNPNAAGEQLTIDFKLPELTNTEIVIYDVVGQIVQKIQSAPKNGKLVFNLANNLGGGIYKVVIIQNNKVITSKKLSIVQ
jgi:hypothetical protein